MARAQRPKLAPPDDTFDPGPGLRAFADILAPPPPEQPYEQAAPYEPTPAAPPHTLGRRWCEWRVPGCNTADAHRTHADPTALARDPHIDAQTLTAIVAAAHRSRRLHITVCERGDLTAGHLTRLCNQSPPRSWSTWLPNHSIDTTADRDACVAALLARDDLSAGNVTRLATWNGLSAEAYLTILEHRAANPRTGFELAATHIGGPSGPAALEAIEATGDWLWRVGAAYARAQPASTAGQLARRARDLARRTRYSSTAAEVICGLADGWDLTCDDLTNTVARIAA